MKTGVSTVPWASVRRPRRAPPSVVRSSNCIVVVVVLGFVLAGDEHRVAVAEEAVALRDRVGDASLLAHAFMHQFGKENGRTGLSLAEDALRAIEGHGWPGNIRELENCIKRATIMADGNQITADDVGLMGAASDDVDRSLDLRVTREAAEQRAVLAALARADGTIAKAADLLGVSRPTLYDLMHRLGLKP